MTFPSKSPVASSGGFSSSASVDRAAPFSGAFFLSALLHGIVAALLVVATWALRQEVLREQPFVVIPSPGGTAGAVPGANSSGVTGAPRLGASASVVDFRQAMARRQRLEESRAEREIARMRAQRRQEEERAREAAPVPAADRPAIRHAAATASGRERVRLEDFRRNNPPPGDGARAEMAESRPGVGRIDLSAVLGGTGGESGGGAPKGAESRSLEGSAMAGYFDEFLSRLRGAHEKPAGLSDLLSAEVELTLAADGSVSGLRFARASGDANFDRSVLDAFARVRMPARPDKKTDRLRITFRMRDA